MSELSVLVSDLMERVKALEKREAEREERVRKLEVTVNLLEKLVEEVTNGQAVSTSVGPHPGLAPETTADLVTAHIANNNNHHHHQSTSPSTGDTPSQSSIQVGITARDTPAASAVRRAQLSGAFLKAVQERNMDEIHKLLAGGADISYRDPTVGYTALHEAVDKGDVGLTIFLIDSGAPLEAVCDGGRTPLYWAARKGHAECVQALVAAGANLNAKNAFGWTPLHSAVRKGHPACARVLLDAGADVTAKTNNGKTPKEMAIDSTRPLFT